MEDRQQNSYPRGFDTFSHNFNAGYGQGLGAVLGSATGGVIIGGITLTGKYAYDSFKTSQTQISSTSELESKEI